MQTRYETREGVPVRVIRSWGGGSRGAILTDLSKARREQLLRMGMVELVEADEPQEVPRGSGKRRRKAGATDG